MRAQFITTYPQPEDGIHYIKKDCGFTSPCWIWCFSLTNSGYGQFYVDGKTCLSHRFIYQAKYGKIPEGLELDHLCKVPSCCNPDHLEAVTHVVNVRRQRSTKLTEDDVQYIREFPNYTRGRQPKGTKSSRVILSEMFHVHPVHIDKIRSGEKWKNSG